MRTMYDSVNAANIPADATMVAGYVDGAYAWSAGEWDRFPRAGHVTITTLGFSNAGDVLDVEAGDATPAQALGWITRRKQAGLYRPTIYCSLSVVPAVRQATGAWILGKDYDIWAADWGGSAAPVPVPGTPPASFAAKQDRSTPGYDVSAVYDDGWPHRTPPAPPAPPAPVPPAKAVAIAALKTLDAYVQAQ